MKQLKKLKKYINEKNLLYLFISILIITTVSDLYTAFKTPAFEFGETNPIYVLTGSVVPLLFFTVIITVWIVRNLRNSISISKIFLFCMITIYLSLGHGVGTVSNIAADNQYKENPQQFIQESQTLSQDDKMSYYFIVVSVVMMLPVIISIISFNVAMYFYHKRQPERDKIIDTIYRLSLKLNKK